MCNVVQCLSCHKNKRWPYSNINGKRDMDTAAMWRGIIRSSSIACNLDFADTDDIPLHEYSSINYYKV